MFRYLQITTFCTNNIGTIDTVSGLLHRIFHILAIHAFLFHDWEEGGAGEGLALFIEVLEHRVSRPFTSNFSKGMLAFICSVHLCIEFICIFIFAEMNMNGPVIVVAANC